MALIQTALPRWPGWRNLPRDTRDTLAFFNDQFDLGSLSMRSVVLS
jgi:hypothetical protein